MMQSPSIVPSRPQPQQRLIIWTKDQRDRRAWEYREHFLRNRKPIQPFHTICEEAMDNHCPKNGPALVRRRKLSRRRRVIIPTNQGLHCRREKLSTLSMEGGDETRQTPSCSQRENLSTLSMEGGHEAKKVELPSITTNLQKATRCRSSGPALASWVGRNLKTCLSRKIGMRRNLKTYLSKNIFDESNAAREVNGS